MTDIKHSDSFLHKLKMDLAGKSPFERFEHFVLLILNLILAIIIVVALARLIENVYHLVILQYNQTTDFKSIQIIFGMLLTLLIAFEFRNSIEAAMNRKSLLIQVKLVILIAIMALGRKFVVLDSDETGAADMLALAGITLSLGGVYWLISNYKK